MSTNTDSFGWMRLSGRLTLGLGLSAAALMFGIAAAHADGKASFGGVAPGAQIAALETLHGPVGTTALAGERAKGFTPDLVAAPDETGKVAVILWDDAWGGLQRRAGSSGTAAAGSNAGSTLAGSSGSQTN